MLMNHIDTGSWKLKENNEKGDESLDVNIRIYGDLKKMNLIDNPVFAGF